MMAAGLRRRTVQQETMDEMKNQFLKVMNRTYQSASSHAEAYASASAEAETLLRSRYGSKRQTCYEDIPVFPHAYREEDSAWASRDLTDDFLPTNFTQKELQNLYMQLAQHSLKLASFVIPTTKTSERPFGEVAVTPMSPIAVSLKVSLLPQAPPPSPPADDMDVDPPPESSSKVDPPSESRKDAKRRKFLKSNAPPDAKIPSKLPQKEVKKEVKKPGKDTYHIIRLRQYDMYLELLRQDSDGYIVAFRILRSLDEFKTAYWCFFCDFSYVSAYLKFLNVKVLKYDSGYSTNLSGLYFGRGTIDVMIDEFLSLIYENPGASCHHHAAGKRFFLILCLVFGEGPRLEAIRNFVFSGMKVSHYEASAHINDSHKLTPLHDFPYSDPELDHHLQGPLILSEQCKLSEHQLGNVLNNLILKWSFSCDTALFLLLVQFEREIKAEIDACRGVNVGSFMELFEQFKSNQEKAHQRCDLLMTMLKPIFQLTKDEDESGKHHKFGQMALFQILNEQLHLLKDNPGLVKSIILRRGNFREKIVVPGLKHEPTARIDHVDVMFWKHFDAFYNLKEEKPIDMILFLRDAIPYLQQFGFDEQHLDLYTDIVRKVEIFDELRVTRRLMLNEAADKAMFDSPPTWTGTGNRRRILRFLRIRRPEQPNPAG